MLFVNALLENVIRYVILLGIAVLGVFAGKALRERKNGKYNEIYSEKESK